MGTILGASASPGQRAIAATSSFRRKVGKIEIMVISDGTLNVPLSFTLSETPPAESAALLAAHGLPTQGMPLQTNVTLVKTASEIVLIDAGSGSNFQDTAGKLADNMQAAGIDPASVSKVIFTHGHPDHLWGAIDDFDNTERFPKASYVISAAEWDFWTHPDTPNAQPDWRKGMALGSARILKRLAGKIDRRRSGDSVAPGISYVETSGHTPGHMSVLIESGNERLLIGGDVLAFAAISFARPDWPIGSDHDRDRGIVTRKRLLGQLASERLPFIGFHLPWPGHGVVERSGMAYRFIPFVY
jgi:glyoxylase-like metal-dependent hydrolase (beta-lactamase superfamily II)